MRETDDRINATHTYSMDFMRVCMYKMHKRSSHERMQREHMSNNDKDVWSVGLLGTYRTHMHTHRHLKKWRRWERETNKCVLKCTLANVQHCTHSKHILWWSVVHSWKETKNDVQKFVAFNLQRALHTGHRRRTSSNTCRIFIHTYGMAIHSAALHVLPSYSYHLTMFCISFHTIFRTHCAFTTGVHYLHYDNQFQVNVDCFDISFALFLALPLLLFIFLFFFAVKMQLFWFRSMV